MKQNQAGIQISRKSFFSSVIILLLLMLAAGILTLVVPAGQFERALTDGRETIVPDLLSLSAGCNIPSGVGSPLHLRSCGQRTHRHSG